MADDLLKEVNWWRDKIGADPATDDEMENVFGLYGPESRIMMLHRLKEDDDGGELTVRQAARRHRTLTRLNDIHRLHLKAGR